MSPQSPSFKAKDITSEDELKQFLERCGLISQSPPDIDWLFPWWLNEFGPHLPPARHLVIPGEENFAPSLCIAVQQDQFVVYLFNERDYWFDRLGEIEAFASADDLKPYLKKLVDQYLVDWKEWMKKDRP